MKFVFEIEFHMLKRGTPINSLEVLLRNWSLKIKQIMCLIIIVLCGDYQPAMSWASFATLLDHIVTLFKVKWILSPTRNNEEMLMFFTDITKNLKTFNLTLKGKDKIISDLTQTVFSFQSKISFIERLYYQEISVNFPISERE